MPLIKKIELKDGVIGIWEKTETLDFFNKLIKEYKDDSRYSRITFEKRKIEFLTVRALLRELFGRPAKITYAENGCPYLDEENLNISISHSASLVAVMLHKNRAGIDIEEQGRPVSTIAQKFMTEQELESIEELPEREDLILLQWSAKEAIFKLAPEDGIDFKTQIILAPFARQDKGNLEATFLYEGKEKPIKLNYQFIDGNALVWCHD